MNLKEIIKISVCMLCLGTMISSLSAMAMENNDDSRKEKQCQLLSESKKEHRKVSITTASGETSLVSEFYAEMYVELTAQGISKEKAEKVSEIYEQRRNVGMDRNRAYIYSNLIIEEKDEKKIQKVLEVYDQLTKVGKEHNYAYAYSKSLIILEENIEKADEIATIYEQKRKEHKSDRYAYMYAVMLAEWQNKYYANDIASNYDKYYKGNSNFWYVFEYLKLISENVSRKKADEVAKIYEKERKEHRSHAYAHMYSCLIGNKKSEISARYVAEVYDKQSEKGKSYYYDRKLNAFLVDRLKEARKIREREAKYNELLEAGRSNYYADRYAIEIADGISDKEADKIATAYELKRKEGKNDMHSYVYARAMSDGRNEKEAEGIATIYEHVCEKIGKYNPDYENFYYLYGYSTSLFEGVTEPMAKRVAETYEQQRRDGKSHDYANMYVRLKGNISDDVNIDSMSKMYERQRAEEKSYLYSNAFILLIAIKKLEPAEAHEKALIYEQKHREGTERGMNFVTACDYALSEINEILMEPAEKRQKL